MTGRTIYQVMADPRHRELAQRVERACVALDQVPLGNYCQLEIAFNEMHAAVRELDRAEQLLAEVDEATRAAIGAEPQ